MQHCLGAKIVEMVARQLHHVHAQPGEQLKIVLAGAKAGATDGAGDGAIGRKRDLVADVGNVGRLQHRANVSPRSQHAKNLHVVAGGAGERRHAAEGDAGELAGVPVGGGAVPGGQKLGNGRFLPHQIHGQRQRVACRVKIGHQGGNTVQPQQLQVGLQRVKRKNE